MSMLHNLIFFHLIMKITSIPGLESFETNAQNYFTKVDLSESCPCDLTDSCEKGCCCDPHCREYMLNNDFFEENFECDPESSSSRRIKSKLEYCEDYKKSIDDLYNPLILAFKILKRGFCLFKDNSKSEEKEEEENDSQDKDNQEDNIKFGDDILKVPLALPSGMCLFNSYPIKNYQDYEVTCTYKDNITDSIVNKILEELKLDKDIKNDINLDGCSNDCAIKKMEIFYYLNENDNDIKCYYEKSDTYQDFTFVIKHFKDRKDLHKSGNPGYIKGKPILIGNLENSNSYISQFRDGIVFPLTTEERKYQDDNYTNYYDNYMDNKLTFEDLIFYQYKGKEGENAYYDFIDCLNDLNSNLYFGNFGNSNFKYKSDWTNIHNINLVNGKSLLLLGVYTDYGLVNNTQFKIQEIEIQNPDTKNNKYFITKFLYKNDTENKWWYSPGPGFFIRVPKNLMYPFQVGTTTYRTKN